MLSRVGAGVQVFLSDGGNSPADVDPTTGHGPEWGKAGPIGLLTIVLLCVAVYFLVKSMNRNLKKVPESFDAVPASVPAGAGGMEGDGSGVAGGGSGVAGGERGAGSPGSGSVAPGDSPDASGPVAST